MLHAKYHADTTKSSRNKNVKEYLMRWSAEVWPRRPMPGFHPGIYRDNVMGREESADPYVDYIKKNKPQGKWKRELITRQSTIADNIASMNVGIHLHIHYTDLVHEILQGISINSINPDIHVTYSGGNENIIKSIFELNNLEYSSIIKVPNRGRDIGPLITELSHYMECNYDFYGHFHTKKSISIEKEEGAKWRKYLITNLLGQDGNRMADKILTDMTNDEKLGLVFPEDPFCVGWTSNYDKASIMAKKIGIRDIPRSLNFPVGNMFWVRSGALSKLYNLKLGWNDYPLEPIGYDGTILHAIERLLPLIAESNGYSYKMTFVSG